jgi:O-acetyl-ADP-ribose deacetylase (regulator of RNase III)
MNEVSVYKVNQTRVEILLGDITQQDTEAIVNAANNQLILGSGVAGAIAKACGPSVQEECNRIGPIKVGEAAITTGGNLKAKWVIHQASMHLGGKTTEKSLRDSTKAVYRIIAEKGITSVSFPAVGTGIAGFPMDKCAEIMIDETINAASSQDTLKLVRFVLFDQKAFTTFKAVADKRLNPS